MSEPTINDLHVLLVENKGDTKLILAQVQDLAKWREQHERDDKVEHKELHERISTTKKYGGAIAIVSVILTALFGHR